MLVCLVSGWFIWFLTLREYDITRSLHKQGGCLDVHPSICSINTQPLRVSQSNDEHQETLRCKITSNQVCDLTTIL